MESEIDIRSLTDTKLVKVHKMRNSDCEINIDMMHKSFEKKNCKI